MQDHKSCENNERKISPNCKSNQLLCIGSQKFEEAEEVNEMKPTGCGFTLALTSDELEQRLRSVIPESHLNSSTRLESQVDCNKPDVCDLADMEFYIDKRRSKPLTSTPCSRKKRVSFQLDEDCGLMDDSGYEGSPTSEQQGLLVSRKGSLGALRKTSEDSFEEDFAGLSLNSSRSCLLSSFSEPDSLEESCSISGLLLEDLVTDRSKQLHDDCENEGKIEIGRDCHEGAKNTEAAPLSFKSTDNFHALPQNSVCVSREDAELSIISSETSTPSFDLQKKLFSCRIPEKSDSGFADRLSELLDASLNISDLNVASVLYANSPDFSLARKVMGAKEYNDRLVMVLREFAPPCLDRLIGRKMGLDRVDVVSELYFRNITGVLSAILGYLSDEDLQSMCKVSVWWKATVKSISFSKYKRHRRRQHPSKRTEHIDRENSFAESSERRLVTIAPKPLHQVQSILEDKISTKCIPNPTERFWLEASRLKNHESLRKCPHCRQPSRVDSAQERAWCVDPKCLYDFCMRCLAPFHSLRPCVGAKYRQSSARQEIKICSGQSKRNLRRL